MSARSVKAKERAQEGVLPVMVFGRDAISERYKKSLEWLVTNGLGGYASGTVSGAPSRGYHGLLVAALSPPVDRRVLIPALVEEVEVGGRTVSLSSLDWQGGTTAPDSTAALVGFRLEGLVPVWEYRMAGLSLTRRLWMEDQADITRIEYAVLAADGPVTLRVGVLTDCRDYHSRSFASDWHPDIAAGGNALSVTYGEMRIHAAMAGARVTPEGQWWRNFDLAGERDRGLTDHEDHIHAGRIEVVLTTGATAQLVLSRGDAPASPDPAALGREIARQRALLDRAALPGDAPDWVRRLVLAADQFIARRDMPDGTAEHTVIAGYHWFTDWGRDTMISLPGLALVTGRPEIARSVLRAFLGMLDAGMIPNRFTDAGGTAEFNTVDATFWLVEAVAAVHRRAPDPAFLREVFGALEAIFAGLKAGTRYNIHVDPADGLVHAGQAGVQLTWMDARVGDWVVTPRIGKPVEVNALWVSNLRFMIEAAETLGRDATPYKAQLDATLAGFQRFWNAERGFCYDVLDGPDGHETLLRPNQILAARKATGALSADQCASIVALCEAELWTPCGLRSLAPSEPGYRPDYGGDQTSRDSAYHMGTVWAWLIGPFIEAHLDVLGDPARTVALLSPLADQLRMAGLGTVSEIFDADAPHTPRGCIAQAWSVAEMLRAWSLLAARTAPATQAKRRLE